MGFFKKIGKGIGKFVKKNINFKTLVKVGGMVDPTGMVSGLQAQHEQAKSEREQLTQMQAQPDFNQLPATEQVMLVKNAVATNQQNAINQISQVAQEKGTTIKEVLQGALGGALQGAGASLAGDTSIAQAGGTATQNVVMNWLKRFWYVPLAVVAVLALLWKMIVKPKRLTRYRR